MKRVSKMILRAAAMALGLAGITGCVVSTVVDEIEKTAGGEYISKSENYQPGALRIQIINNTENIALTIDSIEVCNTIVRNAVTGTIQKGKATILKNYTGTLKLEYQAQTTSASIELPPQPLTPWSAATVPTSTSGTYAKIHGTLYSYLTNGELMQLSQGAIYTPLQGTIAQGSTTTIPIQIHPSAPLYCISDGKIEKALQPIEFDIEIEEWQTE